MRKFVDQKLGIQAPPPHMIHETNGGFGDKLTPETFTLIDQVVTKETEQAAAQPGVRPKRSQQTPNP